MKKKRVLKKRKKEENLCHVSAYSVREADTHECHKSPNFKWCTLCFVVFLVTEESHQVDPKTTEAQNLLAKCTSHHHLTHAD